MIDIIFEDDDILVCYKEAGLAVQSGSVTMPDLEHELRSYLVRRGKGSSTIHVIHRLDQPVEGILVFAKNKKAAASLSKQVQEKGEMSKNYLAVVHGHLLENQKKGELIDMIGRDLSTKSAVIVDKGSALEEKLGAKEASLSYEVKSECVVSLGKIVRFHREDEKSSKDLADEERGLSLLDISLKTGRFHQIRAQLLNLGYPIMGDRRYNTDESNDLSRELQVKNVALCAYKLSFIHPTTGEKMEFEREPKGSIFKYFL